MTGSNIRQLKVYTPSPTVFLIPDEPRRMNITMVLWAVVGMYRLQLGHVPADVMRSQALAWESTVEHSHITNSAIAHRASPTKLKPHPQAHEYRIHESTRMRIRHNLDLHHRFSTA